MVIGFFLLFGYHLQEFFDFCHKNAPKAANEFCVDKSDEQQPLKEGEDYYVENGLMVLTARYLLRRGYCCEHGCRHCPYGFAEKAVERQNGDHEH